MAVYSDGTRCIPVPLSIVSSPLPLERPLPLHWPALRFDLAQFSNRQSYPVWRQRLQDQPLNFSVDRERSHLLTLRPPFGVQSATQV